ncbi:phosphoglucosamine mutase [Thiomicrospira pelophila]|uniref:phosphoglucosamine mutase n=1 Tax=Thiomicrospira pelophila TaxID=934 RepID=UPI0004A6C0B3|nr:phosphoglucosamine mutase [Thiomicrospira pelophila]
MNKKYFGTDGIRCRVGQGLMTPDQVLKLGWATGRVLKARGASKVLIGKDTRISGYMFESALEAGLIYAGVDVLLLGPMPTPAVAYLTRTFHADIGIVISASHNPHYDNGIKFFNESGLKISDEMELAIEAAFDEPMLIDSQLDELAALGRAQRVSDAPGRYIEYCKSTYPLSEKLDGLHLVIDCAHGATYHVAPHVFEELGAKVTTMGDKPNGLNINQGCGATDLAALIEKVKQEKADLGIALDGDGDRLMMIDSSGRVLDGDDLLYILASHTYDEQTGVVGTLMTNLGIENALKKQGLEFIRANVGDRYVMQELKQRGWLLGAEGSGHILCLDKSSTGDGIVAALQVLSVMQLTGKSLSKLLEGVEKYPMGLVNVKVVKPFDLNSDIELVKAIDAFNADYAGQARVLIRASGTEPVVRVMVEAADQEVVTNYVEKLAGLVGKAFS